MPRSRTGVPRTTRRSPAKRQLGAYRTSQTIKRITRLIALDPVFKRLAEATPSGMPYWSGTRPRGTVCGKCSFYGYNKQHPYNCDRYFMLTRQLGAPFPAETPSCHHFTRSQ